MKAPPLGEEPLPLEPGARIGDYTVVAALSITSGQAHVYVVAPNTVGGLGQALLRRRWSLYGLTRKAAWQKRVGVLKIPKDQTRAETAIHREMEHLAQPQADHEHLVKLYRRWIEPTNQRAWGRDSLLKLELPIQGGGTNRFYAIMLDYHAGGSLRELVDKRQLRRLEPSQAVAMALQVADVLDHLHRELKIAYNDLSPDNIMLRDRLSAFGSAVPHYVLIDLAAATSLQQKGTFGPGKRFYQSPERVRRDTEAYDGVSNDIYALGMLLYDMLGGPRPHHEIPDNDWLDWKKKIQPAREIAPQASLELEQLISDATQQDLAQRKKALPTMAAFRERLIALPEAQRPPAMKGVMTKHTWARITTALVMLLVVVGVAWALLQPVQACSEPGCEGIAPAGPTAIPTITPILTPTATMTATPEPTVEQITPTSTRVRTTPTPRP